MGVRMSSRKIQNLMYPSFLIKIDDEICQGEVWSDLPWYHGTSTGIVITPRCDLAQRKTNIVNFLRVVPLYDLRIELAEIAAQRTLKNLDDAISNLLKKAGLDSHVFLGIPAKECLEIGADQSKMSAKSKADISERINRHERLTAGERAAELIDASILRGLVRDVVRNRDSDYFFLPRFGDMPHSVACLREIGVIDRGVLERAAKCISQDSWNLLIADSPLLFPEKQPRRMAELNSPFIECLMARFAASFGRVGTEDLSPQEIESVLEEVLG